MPSAEPALFQTVSDDYFKLLDKSGSPNSKKVVDLLELKKEDVSVASDVPLRSIRYDSRIPAELLARIREWATALNLVASYFNDTTKTILWFQTPNPLLGNISPRDMIRIGRFKKLLKFVQTSLSENRK